LSKEATWIDGEIASAVIAPPQAVESYAPAAHGKKDKWCRMLLRSWSMPRT
jgi:hypothetical protein